VSFPALNQQPRFPLNWIFGCLASVLWPVFFTRWHQCVLWLLLMSGCAAEIYFSHFLVLSAVLYSILFPCFFADEYILQVYETFHKTGLAVTSNDTCKPVVNCWNNSMCSTRVICYRGKVSSGEMVHGFIYSMAGCVTGQSCNSRRCHSQGVTDNSSKYHVYFFIRHPTSEYLTHIVYS